MVHVAHICAYGVETVKWHSSSYYLNNDTPSSLFERLVKGNRTKTALVTGCQYGIHVKLTQLEYVEHRIACTNGAQLNELIGMKVEVMALLQLN